MAAHIPARVQAAASQVSGKKLLPGIRNRAGYLPLTGEIGYADFPRPEIFKSY